MVPGPVGLKHIMTIPTEAALAAATLHPAARARHRRGGDPVAGAD